MTSVTRQINFKEAQERYELEAAPASFSVDGNGVCNDTVVVRLYHEKGGEKEEIQGDGVTLSVDGSSVDNFTLPLSLHASTGNNDTHSAYVSSFLSAGSKNFLVSAAHGSNALTIPVIRNGEKGATPRIQAWSDLPVGYHFYQGTTGEGYKDTVIYNGNYYTCVKSHVKTADNYPASTTDTNNGYWKSGEKIELVATNLLLSAYALIKNLGVEAIEMKDSEGNILFTAKDGNVTCKTGTFENITIGSGCVNYGVNRQPFFDAREASFSDSWLEPMLHDNIVYPLSIGRYSPAYLPWDEKANGRRIVIVNEYADGAGYTITAPTGKCFYEDGIAKTVLNIANEAVFLVGYGNKYQSFSGWIVLSRVPLNRRYNQGTPRRVLYQGKCSNGGSLRYWTFDGSTLTSSRFGQGHYRITFGKSFTSVDDYEVILSSYGVYGHETTQQVYASLGAKTTSYFEVLMADDSSMNDANFLFEVIPATRWHS